MALCSAPLPSVASPDAMFNMFPLRQYLRFSIFLEGWDKTVFCILDWTERPDGIRSFAGERSGSDLSQCIEDFKASLSFPHSLFLPLLEISLPIKYPAITRYIFWFCCCSSSNRMRPYVSL